jgi:hypothetical protein
MRSNTSLFLLLPFFLLSACHKSGSGAATNFSGDWRLVQLNGGPAIDVVPVDRDHVYILRLLPDSTREDYINGKLSGKGTWSLKPAGSPLGNVKILVFGDSLGVNRSPLVQQAQLVDGKLVIKLVPDEGYKAVYTRN